jgi:hypothetical protein
MKFLEKLSNRLPYVVQESPLDPITWIFAVPLLVLYGIGYIVGGLT